MANRWRNSGNSERLYFFSSKITADGDCSHEIKRHLFLWRQVMTNLDSILKSRGIILPTKFPLVKAIVFPVVIYGCESWTKRKLSTEKLMLLTYGVGCKEVTHLKRPWCWEKLKAGGEGEDRGWNGWMASPTQWTRVWVNSGIWWWTGRPGVL